MLRESRVKLERAPEDVDYVIVGSGIGGLSCAALLTFYGYSVVVCEAHYLPGGVAHTVERKPYNPLREILGIIGEGNSVQYAQYDGWIMHVPEES